MQPGQLVRCVVTGHDPWGLRVRALPPAPAEDGTIDIALVSEKRPFDPAVDYPAIGSELEAVVIAYTPSTELRLNARESVVAAARKENEE